MSERVAPVDIPKRALFKAAEVCDLVKVQPYVLRTWEAEFPDLGLAKSAGAPRVYRRTDVEQVARIKHLLLVEGLTLAGARRRLEEQTSPVGADQPAIDELLGQNARERLTAVKRGLVSILELLGTGYGYRRQAAGSALDAEPSVSGRAVGTRGAGGSKTARPRAKPARSTTARRRRST